MDRKTSDQKTVQVESQWQFERLYLKKANMELINVPELFEKTWKPQIDLKFHSGTATLSDRRFEVTLGLTLTCVNHNEKAYVMNVEQAAIVQLKPNLSETEMRNIISLEVTNALFAYLRETTDSLAVKASLPPFALAHVDFGKLVQQAFRQADKEALNKKIKPTDNDELLN